MKRTHTYFFASTLLVLAQTSASAQTEQQEPPEQIEQIEQIEQQELGEQKDPQAQTKPTQQQEQMDQTTQGPKQSQQQEQTEQKEPPQQQEQRQQTWLSIQGSPLAFSLHAEVGFVAPLAHSIQFGKKGTRLDYIKDAGQDNLFPFARISAEAQLFDHNNLIFLYQPLQLTTSERLRQDLVVDEVTFRKGTSMNFIYGFDFWRLSYLFDFFSDPSTELGIGASLQIRNATIGFEQQNGERSRYTRDIGPVPILKVRGRTDIGRHFWVGGEFDGFWAPIRYVNGGSSDVEGAIADLSLRAGAHLARGVDGFVGLRYLGGGARGTSNSDPNPGDGYVDNWLHFGSVTLGFSLR